MKPKAYVDKGEDR